MAQNDRDSKANAYAQTLAAQPGAREKFIALIDPSRSTKLPLADPGLSAQCVEDAMDCLGINMKTQFIVVLHLIRILTESHGCSPMFWTNITSLTSAK